MARCGAGRSGPGARPVHQDNIVFVPFNEPEGNTFGTGTWSYDGTSWLDDPKDYFAAWDEVYALIKARWRRHESPPEHQRALRQVKGYLEHVSGAHTVPDVMTWHELSGPGLDPDQRSDVPQVGEGRSSQGPLMRAGRPDQHQRVRAQLPHLGARTDDPVDLCDRRSPRSTPTSRTGTSTNLSDSAVQATAATASGLFNPMRHDRSHGRSGAARAPAELHDAGKSPPSTRARPGACAFGGHVARATSSSTRACAGSRQTVHALIREIAWDRAVGDSGQPEGRRRAQRPDQGTGRRVHFGIAAPGPHGILGLRDHPDARPPMPRRPLSRPTSGSPPTSGGRDLHGSGYSRNGPEGSPADVSKFVHLGGIPRRRVAHGLRRGAGTSPWTSPRTARTT